ncbi:unnamed protein product, partial [Rotaria sp. Silwood2]
MTESLTANIRGQCMSFKFQNLRHKEQIKTFFLEIGLQLQKVSNADEKLICTRHIISALFVIDLPDEYLASYANLFKSFQESLEIILQRWLRNNMLSEDDNVLFNDINEVFMRLIYSEQYKLYVEEYEIDIGKNYSPHYIYLKNSLVETVGQCLYNIYQHGSLLNDQCLNQLDTLLYIIGKCGTEILLWNETLTRLYLITIDCLNSKFYFDVIENLDPNVLTFKSIESFLLLGCTKLLCVYTTSQSEYCNMNIFDTLIEKWNHLLTHCLPRIKTWTQPMVSAVKYIIRIIHNILRDNEAETKNHIKKDFLKHFLTILSHKHLLELSENGSKNARNILSNLSLILYELYREDKTLFVQQNIDDMKQLFLQLAQFSHCDELILHASMITAHLLSSTDIKKMDDKTCMVLVKLYSNILREPSSLCNPLYGGLVCQRIVSLMSVLLQCNGVATQYIQIGGLNDLGNLLRSISKKMNRINDTELDNETKILQGVLECIYYLCDRKYISASMMQKEWLECMENDLSSIETFYKAIQNIKLLLGCSDGIQHAPLQESGKAIEEYPYDSKVLEHHAWFQLPSKRFLNLSNGRSGSTLLSQYIMCHPKIFMHGELLPDLFLMEDDAFSSDSMIEQLDRDLSLCAVGSAEGFKILVDKFNASKISLLRLIHRLNISFVVLCWRKQLIDSFVSLKIAERTKCWYSERVINSEVKIFVDENEFNNYCKDLRQKWQLAIDEISNHVPVLLIEYSELCRNPKQCLAPIFNACGFEEIDVSALMIRQNPGPPAQKIINWNDLSDNVKNAELNVNEMFTNTVALFSGKPKEWWPEPEPLPVTGEWNYRVAEPYIAPEAIDNVIKSLAYRKISSASSNILHMAFELRRFYNVPVAQPCANGFISLLLALQSAHIGRGDYVLVPTFTMIAVPNAVLYVGAQPLFVDNENGSYNPGAKQFEEVAKQKIGCNIKAVIVCHTYSVPADIHGIVEMCKAHNWLLIEDISECIGVKVGGRLLGTFGLYGCASLYANKTITAGDGGFVISQDATASARLISIVNHGFTPKYHFVHHEPCIDGKINGLAAALVTPAIPRILDVIAHRKQITQWYRTALSKFKNEIRCMPIAGDEDGPWVFGIECISREEKEKLRKFLAQDYGIETRNYFPPLNLQSAFCDLPGIKATSCPNAESLANRGFYLPSHYWLRESDITNICSAIGSYFTHEHCLITESNFSSPVLVSVDPRTAELRAVAVDNEEQCQIALDAVKATLAIRKFFVVKRENWSDCESLQHWLKELASEKSLSNDLRTYFRFYSHYLKNMQNNDHLLPVPITQPPWSDFELLHCTIPTSTPTEVQKLLCWLCDSYKCKNIVELGSWLGGTTIQMLNACRDDNVCITVFDGFRWQEWMNEIVSPHLRRATGKLFLKDFISNIRTVTSRKSAVVPIQLPIDSNIWPELENIVKKNIDLVYIDISDEVNEIELLWKVLEPHLVHNKSLVVTHTYGWSPGVCCFVQNHFADLKPLYKPASFAKAFLYVGPYNKTVNGITTLPFPKKVTFAESPDDWTHHRGGGYCAIIEYTKQCLHTDNATIVFIPAVEQYFFHKRMVVEEPWIGVMHQAPNCDTIWISDSNRLLKSPLFLDSLRHCYGLYTLNRHLRDYIRQNLPYDTSIPVCQLYYPICSSISLSSTMKTVRSKIVMIGNYMRNFDDFVQLCTPSGLQKAILIEETSNEFQERSVIAANQNIDIITRCSDSDYEDLLKSSIAFLSLKSDGIASTLVIECIWSNTPILARRFSSLEEYLGQKYPFFFDSLDEAAALLCSSQKLYAAQQYLQEMNKSHLTKEHFVQSIVRSAPYQNLPSLSPISSTFEKFDVTVCLCSYQRTENLHSILHSLLYKQDYEGKIEIILWNNNFDRRDTVDNICRQFNGPIHIVHSSTNYYCIIRLSVVPLMNSDVLIIVDDDMIPLTHFISTFVEQHMLSGTKVLLCLHGHKFSPHELNTECPDVVWSDTGVVEFIDDDMPSQPIHYAHADGCLIPRQALKDACSIDMPKKEFVLVDDYWLSFVLSHYFDYQICKITSEKGCPYVKTSSADDPKTALYLNPTVIALRTELYVYHMLQRWPVFNNIYCPLQTSPAIRIEKVDRWKKPFVGFNIPMSLHPDDMKVLQMLGVTVVRLGAVCDTLHGDDNSENIISDLAFLAPSCMNQIIPSALQELVTYIQHFAVYNIDVIITLHRHLAIPNVWKQIATVLKDVPNVIGYDLINEPFTIDEQSHCIDDLDTCFPNDITLMEYYADIIENIRQIDQNTPIIIETSFWASWKTLRQINFKKYLRKFAKDKDLFKVSFHMYEPQSLTNNRSNDGKYVYPGIAPTYDGNYAIIKEWNLSMFKNTFQKINEITKNVLELDSSQVFVGEVGIVRHVEGASQYLEDILHLCQSFRWSVCIYCFREHHWDGMDYELGVEPSNKKSRSQ